MPNRPAQPRPSLLRGFHLLNIERFAWPSSLSPCRNYAVTFCLPMIFAIRASTKRFDYSWTDAADARLVFLAASASMA
jgi:hypothetical protein